MHDVIFEAIVNIQNRVSIVSVFAVLFLCSIASPDARVYGASDKPETALYGRFTCYAEGEFRSCNKRQDLRDVVNKDSEAKKGDAGARYKIVRSGAKGSCEKRTLVDLPPITLGAEDSGKVIQGVRMSNKDGACITIKGATNVRIENSLFIGCKIGVYGYDVSSIFVKGNRFERNGSAIKIARSEGPINIVYNEYQDLGVFNLDWGANFVELNEVKGSGVLVGYNVGECSILRGCNTEDLVSIFKSEGDKANPIVVVGNQFRGRGKSSSGSGIVAGDYGGGNVAILDNILVNPGQVGIGIVGGHDITIRNNTMFHGTDTGLVSGTAIMVGKWGGGGECVNHRILYNRSNWYSSRGKVKSSWWPFGKDYSKECFEGVVENRGNIPTLDISDTSGSDGSLNETVLPEEIFKGLPANFFSSCN